MSVSVSTFGVLAAFAGIEHGVGEILQGSIPPPGLVIESWPDADAFRLLAGEPALTIVPNLLASGVLTILVALALGVWAVRFIDRRSGGTVLLGLSILLFLVGGGFGPPILGAILGVAALGTDAAPQSRGVTVPRGRAARLWPWALAASVVAWLALFPGTVIVSYVFGLGESDAASLVALVPMVSAFALLPITLVAAWSRDREGRTVRAATAASA